jgi:hypothetical protein
MQMSATLKTGQFGSREEVDDVATERPGVPEQPVEQVARHAREQEPQAHPPSLGGGPG